MRSVDNMVAVGDDLALAVFDHGPVDARPLVLAHGMTWDHRHFAPLIAELVAEGHRVVTYDARGVGQSTRPVTDPAAHALAAQADDLAILLATLGGPQPVIGGVSAGAAISLEVARLGHPISGLVQIAPGVGPNGVAPETRDYLAWMTACVGKGGWPALQDGIAASDQPASAIADQLALAKVWESIFDVKSFVAMINGFPGSLPPAGPVVAVPTLIIGWEDDAMHPMAFVDHVAAQTTSPTVVTLAPPTSSALPMPTVADAIGDFVAELAD